MEPIFHVDGDRLVPTAHAAGPWDTRYQHGGTVSALIARAAEGKSHDAPMHVARIAVDLLAPVPVEPLVVRVGEAPGSTNIRRARVVVTCGDEHVAEGRVLFVRSADLDHAPVEPPRHERPGPDEGRPLAFPHEVEGEGAFHRTGMEVRFVKGGFDQPGPASAWFRFRRPLVDGETPTPLQLVSAACDFGNGISWAIPPDRYVFINPDLTIHLARLPVGEWLGLTAVTVAQPNGMAYAEGTLFDAEGRIGRSVQSLFVDTRR